MYFAVAKIQYVCLEKEMKYEKALKCVAIANVFFLTNFIWNLETLSTKGLNELGFLKSKYKLVKKVKLITPKI